MKKICDFWKEKRWLHLQWLRSYVVVVLVIAVILATYSLVIVVQIKRDANSNNQRFATYYQTIMEKSLKSLQDFSTTLLYSEPAKTMHTYNADTIKASEALSVGYDLVYSIRNFIMVNGMLEDIYVYYPDVGCVVGQNGVYDSYVYYKTENYAEDPQQEQYETWMRRLFFQTGNGFFLGTDELNRNSVYYYQRVLYGEEGSSSRILVAKIGGELLGTFFEDLVHASNYRFVALVDKSGVIYVSAGQKEEYAEENDIFDPQDYSRRQIVYMAASDVWPLTFVSVQDYGTAYNIVLIIGEILLVGILLALMVGTGLALHYAYRDKAAIDKLADRFERQSDDGRYRDLAYIGNQIDKLMEANSNAVRAASEQMKIIKSFFLKEILKKKDCTEKDIDILSAVYGLSMENSMFSLVIAWPSEKGVWIDRKRVESFLDIATNDDSDDDFVVYWTQEDHLEVFLCNYENRTKSRQGPVVKFAKAMRDYCNCEIQISPVMNSSAEIQSVWNHMHAQHMPEHAIPKEPVQDQILLALRAFNDALDQDDLTSAIALVPKLNRKFLSHSNENLVRCRKYMLLAKLYETYESDSMRRKIDQLLLSVDSEDWSQRLEAMLQCVDQDINRKVDMRQVAEIAYDMIHKEYYNSQLCLHMIADHIGVSQSYLTRLYKNKYGMSVIQHLNQVRVEEAKRLMLEGSDNLKVIATKVGFLSDVTLIRVFKKYENMTPGNFRNQW